LAVARFPPTPFTAPGGHIYGWTLGFDLTAIDGAREFGHADISELILSALSPKAQLIDSLRCVGGERVRRELDRRPAALKDLEPQEHSLLPAAAW
jgi:hypothetical protein